MSMWIDVEVNGYIDAYSDVDVYIVVHPVDEANPKTKRFRISQKGLVSHAHGPQRPIFIILL